MKTLHSMARVFKKRGLLAGCSMLVMGISLMTALSLLGAPVSPASAEMDMDMTLSDGAQRCTIAFDGFAFISGTFEAQSFFPPGKLADYWGFQYLRDNTSNGNGHNTSFLTNCAFNVLSMLSADQFAMLKTLAVNQVEQINLYGYKRFPLMKAFHRQLDGDIPDGSSGLDLDAVKTASGDLYKLDGQISFDRAVVYASIFKTLDSTQKAHLDAMQSGGFDTWTVTTEMESAVRELMKGVSHDVSVALMTYAGDLFSWYAGSLDADVYFCPERQGTYFGSFYVKDAPAIGHEGYKIDEQLTASAGQKFLDTLATTGLDTLVTSLVDKQKEDLYTGADNIVLARTDISTLLRSLVTASELTDELKAGVLAKVLERSQTYGELDGEIVYSYTMAFAQVYDAMTDAQKATLTALRKTIMSGTYDNVAFDFSVCTTPYLFSAVIDDVSVLAPYIANTNYLFGVSDEDTIAVKVSPSTAKVQIGGTQQFTAEVSGATDTTVVWQVGGVTGGDDTVGTISTSGLYTAPSSVPNPASVTVTAIANADATKSAEATVTVTVAPPVAAFSLSPTSPTVGVTVSFTDASTGSPTSWSWKFGDGAAGTSQNPTHAYSKAGSYTVILTAANAGGSSTATKTLTVTVAPPVAAFSFSPSAPAMGKAVSFTDASTGTPTSWLWKFGDGAVSTSRNPAHTYSKAGSYTVTLTAANAGGSSTSTQTLTVSSVVKPAAAFSFSPSAPTVGNAVSFTDASTGSPTSWSWKFGDGGTSTSQNPTHTYSKAGSYTVTLVAANAGGSGTTTKTLNVRVVKPVAAFSFSPSAPTVGKTVSFKDVSTGGPTSWSWKFGDGTTSTSQNPTHVYGKAGTYTVTLTARNTAGTGTLTKTLTVSVAASVASGFSFSPSAPAVGKSVSFTDTSTGSPTSWSWKFGDGATSTSQNPTHAYSKAGPYTVSLTVRNARGSSTSNKTLTVSAAAPVAAFSFSPSAPVVGSSVSFTDASTGSPTSWSWKFGDGATSTSQNPTHAYSAAGSYTVTLTAANAGGSSTVERTLVVNSTTASFSLNSDAGVDGGILPAAYTCDGAGSSPALSWSNAPEGTKEFALMMTTIPVDGATKWNWVLYSIPATTTGLVKDSSGVGILGVGSNGSTMAYQPPCSQGPGPKLYTFTVYALSASPSLPAEANQVTGPVLTQAISSITLGSASLNLTHTRP